MRESLKMLLLLLENCFKTQSFGNKSIWMVSLILLNAKHGEAITAGEGNFTPNVSVIVDPGEAALIHPSLSCCFCTVELPPALMKEWL